MNRACIKMVAGVEGASLAAEDPANRSLEQVLRLCQEMLELADFGDNHRRDAGCGVVFGRLRDAAYKVRRLAEHELREHGIRDPGAAEETGRRPTRNQEAEET